MKRRHIITLLGSLVAGFALTFLFLAVNTQTSVGDCSDTSVPLPQTVRTVDCHGTNYGFPLKFIESDPGLSLSRVGENSLQTSVSATATSNVDIFGMLVNIVFWTAFGAAIALAIMYKMGTKKKQAATPVEPKEEK